jgi:hypothetical protein
MFGPSAGTSLVTISRHGKYEQKVLKSAGTKIFITTLTYFLKRNLWVFSLYTYVFAKGITR